MRNIWFYAVVIDNIVFYNVKPYFDFFISINSYVFPYNISLIVFPFAYITFFSSLLIPFFFIKGVTTPPRT